MRIVIGSVVKGFALKSAIKQWLEKAGHTVLDVGCADTAVFVKFPSVAERAARLLQKGEADLGVLCCGSGTGMALAAGKFAGICAIAAEAEFGRRVNDANVVCMGESLVAPDVGCRIVQCFLETKFQDAPAIPERVRTFWAEARDEIRAKGVVARDRNLETLP
ncbi:MAG: RpiB/LacA/LacB family sugar-phosphate isomerase [Verrucomicrobia bacterium]|nr:RpiB/LacA/LacB family sugar-phosphate isomerase [Verrucomicrobiota bacterium]